MTMFDIHLQMLRRMFCVEYSGVKGKQLLNKETDGLSSQHTRPWSRKILRVGELETLAVDTSSSALKCSLAITQIRLLMFLMNWTVVPSSSVNSCSLSFNSVPDRCRHILSGALVGQFCMMCLGTWTHVPLGQSLV